MKAIRVIRIWFGAVVWSVRHAGNYGTVASRRETGANALGIFHIAMGLIVLSFTELTFGYKGLLSTLRGHGTEALFIPFVASVILIFYRCSYRTIPLRKENVGLSRSAIVKGSGMVGLFWKIVIFLVSMLLVALMCVLAVMTYPARGPQ